MIIDSQLDYRCYYYREGVKWLGNSYYENLPAVWAVATVDMLFSIVGGGPPATANSEYWGDGVPWFSSADIDDTGNITSRRFVTPLGIKNSTTNIVPADSVVVVTRVGLGKVAVLREPMCFSQDNQALLPKYEGVINARFLFHVAYHEMQTLKLSGRGTRISGITKKQLEDVVILLPPLAEQVRIVQSIEIAYEKLNNIAENLN